MARLGIKCIVMIKVASYQARNKLSQIRKQDFMIHFLKMGAIKYKTWNQD